MGKKGNKLKSSLEKHKTNQAIKQQQKVQDKKKEKTKVLAKPDKLPFREDDYVLLVGEGALHLHCCSHLTKSLGNFSFTLSLVVDHQFESGQLVSTAVDSEEVGSIVF